MNNRSILKIVSPDETKNPTEIYEEFLTPVGVTFRYVERKM